MGITCIHPIVSSLRTGSSTHMGINRLHTRIYECLIVCPHSLPRTLLRDALTPSPPTGFPRDLLQGCPELCLQQLLTQPCVPPAPSPLIACIPCTNLEYNPKRHPLCYPPLSSSYVSCIQLSFRCFPRFLRRWRRLCTACLLPYPLSRDFLRNPM